MYEVLLCHRRNRQVSGKAFHTQWGDERRRLVLGLKEQLGYNRYSQLHQLSRWNILYQAIRLSRSWPFTAFFSALRGLPLPPLFRDRGTEREEQWDLVEAFWYPSREALLHSLTSQAGAEAGSRLAADGKRWVRRTAVITAEVFVANEDSTLRYPRIVTLFCLRTLSSMTREQMLDHWGTSHKKLVMSLQSALKYRKYDQLHVRSAPELTTVVENLGGSAGEEFDGVAALVYGSQWELVRALVNPRTQIANLKLVKDEVTFIDHTRSALVFGREDSFER